MKAFVITVMHHEKSLESANKCIESCRKFGLDVNLYPAFTPKDNPLKIIDTITGKKCFGGRLQREPRPDCVAATFASQLSLWSRCVHSDEDFLILEHDARMIAPIPEVEYDGCMTLGKPSWGEPPEETDTGVLPIVQHTHGNHAILMSPHGAKRIMEYFENKETPTLDPADLFLGEARFDFIQKHVPYSFEVEDTFTLIQEGISTKVKLDVDFDNYEELDPDENFHHSNNS